MASTGQMTPTFLGISAERLGSHGSKVFSSPVDCYLIRRARGKELARIFISPYQGGVSRKAPREFIVD